MGNGLSHRVFSVTTVKQAKYMSEKFTTSENEKALKHSEPGCARFHHREHNFSERFWLSLQAVDNVKLELCIAKD